MFSPTSPIHSAKVRLISELIRVAENEQALIDELCAARKEGDRDTVYRIAGEIAGIPGANCQDTAS